MMENKRDVYWQDIKTPAPGDLRDKVAVITGGGKGIGRATAENFLHDGACVVVLSRRTGKDLAVQYPKCFHKDCDVRDFTSVKRVIEEIVFELGRIDILFNCAGVALLTLIKDEPEELFDQIVDTNFKGVRNCTVAACKYLEKSRGCIINIGSIWGMPGINLPGDATYSAIDAAIIKYSEVAAEEFESIRVNCISPALADTDINDDMSEQDKQKFIEAYTDRSTLLQPQEIAEVAEYISKSDINQKTIIIDAGYTKRVKH